jgi:hypothetical protein
MRLIVCNGATCPSCYIISYFTTLGTMTIITSYEILHCSAYRIFIGRKCLLKEIKLEAELRVLNTEWLVCSQDKFYYAS